MGRAIVWLRMPAGGSVLILSGRRLGPDGLGRRPDGCAVLARVSAKIVPCIFHLALAVPLYRTVGSHLFWHRAPRWPGMMQTVSSIWPGFVSSICHFPHGPSSLERRRGVQSAPCGRCLLSGGPEA